MDEIVKKDNNDVSTLNKKSELNIFGFREKEILKINISNNDTFNVGEKLGRIISDANVFSQANNVIDPKSTYVVDVPMDIKKGLEEGKFWLTKKKSGDTMAQVRHIVNGKEEILTNLNIKEDKIPSNVAVNNLMTASYQRAMQQQLERVYETVVEIKEIVSEIKNIQEDDRLGEILGDKLNLSVAILIKNENDRKQQLNIIAHSLFESTGKIRKTIKRKIENYKRIPKSDWMITVNQIIHKRYKSTRDKEFNDICKYIEYYVETHRLLIYIYKLSNEEDAISKIYELNNEFISSINFSNISTYKNLYPEKIYDIEWYESPTMILEENKNRYIEETNINKKCLSIEMKGEQLKEVLHAKRKKK